MNWLVALWRRRYCAKRTTFPVSSAASTSSKMTNGAGCTECSANRSARAAIVRSPPLRASMPMNRFIGGVGWYFVPPLNGSSTLSSVRYAVPCTPAARVPSVSSLYALPTFSLMISNACMNLRMRRSLARLNSLLRWRWSSRISSSVRSMSPSFRSLVAYLFAALRFGARRSISRSTSAMDSSSSRPSSCSLRGSKPALRQRAGISLKSIATTAPPPRAPAAPGCTEASSMLKASDVFCPSETSTMVSSSSPLASSAAPRRFARRPPTLGPSLARLRASSPLTTGTCTDSSVQRWKTFLRSCRSFSVAIVVVATILRALAIASFSSALRFATERICASMPSSWALIFWSSFVDASAAFSAAPMMPSCALSSFEALISSSLVRFSATSMSLELRSPMRLFSASSWFRRRPIKTRYC
eukprot:PhM_4_TR13266/c0_g1_i1/m.48550